MLPLLALINFLLILIQLLLGLLAWKVRKKRVSKFSFPVSSQLEPAELVEKYFYDDKYSFELEATDEIDEPAYATDDKLLINRYVLNKKDLYSNFYLIYQAELASDEYNFYRKYPNIVSGVFFLMFLGSMGAVLLGDVAGLVVMIFMIFLNSLIFGLVVWAARKQDTLLNKSQEIAYAVMDPDAVEKARIKALVEDIKYEIVEYPWEVVWRLWVFFTP